MAETREDRKEELQRIWAADCIRLIRLYQDVIGTPHGQIPIPGISASRMIEAILKKEFRLTTTWPVGVLKLPPLKQKEILDQVQDA
jgi:hypothetical protein